MKRIENISFVPSTTNTGCIIYYRVTTNKDFNTVSFNRVQCGGVGSLSSKIYQVVYKERGQLGIFENIELNHHHQPPSGLRVF